MNKNSKTSDEVGEIAELPERSIHSPDDIVGEIADRRLLKTFSTDLSPEKFATLIEIPDQIEDTDDFHATAHTHGLDIGENVLGYSTNPESPAHIRRNEVPSEIATKIHEDLHRMTDPESLKEAAASEPLRQAYEGITEYLTQEAVGDLPGNVSGESYPEETAWAKALANEVGEDSLRAYFFHHELSDEIKQALDRDHEL